MRSILPAAEAAVVAHMYLHQHPHQVIADMQHQRLRRRQGRQVHRQIIQDRRHLLHIQPCAPIIIMGIPIIKEAARRSVDIIRATQAQQVEQV